MRPRPALALALLALAPLALLAARGQGPPAPGAAGPALRAGTVNVMDFSAVKGDGETDDSAAVQAVLDAHPGRTVYLPRTRKSVVNAAGGYTLSFFFRRTLVLRDPGTALVGDGPSTVLKFAPGVAGVELRGGANALRDLQIQGSEPWIGGVDYWNGVVPAGRHPGLTEAAGASAADGVRVCAPSCELTRVAIVYFGRDGVNASAGDQGLPPGQGAECLVMTAVQASNNRGHGIRLEGGDSNCAQLNAPNVNVNQFWGIDCEPFLAATILSAQADQNGFDSTRGLGAVPPAGALRSLSRKGGTVTLTFKEPYRVHDGTLPFRVGQGVTVSGCGAVWDGTFVALSVSADATTLTYAQAGGDAAADAPAGAARMAYPAETWQAAGLLGGAFYSPNPTARVVWVNPYAEGGQRCRFAGANLVLNPVWSQEPDCDATWPDVPVVIRPDGGGTGRPTINRPWGVYSPDDGPVSSVVSVGKTAMGDLVDHHTDPAAGGRTVWKVTRGPTDYRVSEGDPDTDAAALDRLRISRDVGYTKINSKAGASLALNFDPGAGQDVYLGDGGKTVTKVTGNRIATGQVILAPTADADAPAGALFLGSDHKDKDGNPQLCLKGPSGVRVFHTDAH